MTEKRFNYHMGLICEKKDGEYYSLTIKEVVDCLNALHEENEQLKKQISNLEHTRDFCADVCADCKRLEEENEQLKKELESFKPVIFESDGKPVTLYKKVME